MLRKPKVETTLKQIEVLEAEIDAHKNEGKVLQERIKNKIKKMQETCSHPEEFLREGQYKEGWDNYYDGRVGTRPPFRVCARCGYAEEGWGCGYWKLRNNYNSVSSLSREEAWKLVRGEFHTQSKLDKIRFPKAPRNGEKKCVNKMIPHMRRK